MKNRASLERRLIYLFSLAVFLPLLLCIYIIASQGLGWLEGFTLILFFLLPGGWVFYQSYKNIIDVLERVGLQLDSLGNEEYNSWHLAGYNGGQIEALRQDFDKLGRQLANKRLEYMHNESFLSEFIKELDLPILVLDHHQRIFSSNASFDALTNTSIHALIGKKPAGLGIEQNAGKWQLNHSARFGQRYEITHHIFKRSGRNYQLLVLFSVEERLRDNEKEVWQRLIRVLNHEVRNSLTPIYSMSQSLQEMKLAGPLNDQQKKLEGNILQVIEQRAKQLLEFVDSYSAFSKLAPAELKNIAAYEVSQRLAAIFPRLEIELGSEMQVRADIGQLEQALINLIKNAFEASPNDSPVVIRWQQHKLYTEIAIYDSGPGISNPDNLFVPFYSTKEQGSGIGLVLSRELIRNQGGELTLSNRHDDHGAEACIRLPC